MIRICYLYYDLLNLYGEKGNIIAIEHYLKNNNIKYSIDYISTNQKINFMDYNLIYIGCGDKRSLSIALEDLKKHKENLKLYINKNKHLLATGSSLELFSNQHLKLLDFDITYCNRFTKSINIKKENLKGYLNQSSNIIENKFSKFNNLAIQKNNTFLTYLLGPFLIENEWFLIQLIESIKKTK